MKRIRVEAGASVRWQGQEHVILNVLDLKRVLLRNLETRAVDSAHIAELSPVSDDGDGPIKKEIDLAGVPDEDWAEAQRRFEIIHPLVNNSERTRTQVEAAAASAGVHWTTLYRWIQAYEATGRKSELLPKRPSGGRGKGRLPDESEELLRKVIRATYLDSQKRSVAKTIEAVVQSFKTEGLTAPDGTTVRRRIYNLCEEEVSTRREGRRAAKEQFEPKPGTIGGADVPLAIAQIDHTLLDIMLVDEEERRDIGRPWLTVLIDVYSRMILGFYVSLDPPGSIGTGLCIASGVLPKEHWLLGIGVEGEWPCWGFPTVILADNAKEFRGKMLSRAAEEYGFTLRFRPVRKPRYGAHIERLMGTVAEEIHALPGTTFANPAERGEYNSAAWASFTLAELEAWLADWIVNVYHRRIHSSLKRPPIAVWQEGLQGTKKRPGIGLPERITDPTRLRIDFMPYEERVLQPFGFEVDYIQYYSKKLDPFIGRKDPDNPKRKRRFRLHYDPRNMSRFYYLDPVLGRYEDVGYRNTMRPEASRWELREARRTLVEMGRSEIDEEMLFQALARLRHRTDTAKKTTTKVRRSRARRRDHQRRGGPVIGEPLRPTQRSLGSAEDEWEDAPPKAPEAPLQPFDEDDPLGEW